MMKNNKRDRTRLDDQTAASLLSGIHTKITEVYDGLPVDLREKVDAETKRFHGVSLLTLVDSMNTAKRALAAATDGRPGPLFLVGDDEFAFCFGTDAKNGKQVLIQQGELTGADLIRLRDWIDKVLEWRKGQTTKDMDDGKQ